MKETLYATMMLQRATGNSLRARVKSFFTKAVSHV
jgi:hypothetical protein